MSMLANSLNHCWTQVTQGVRYGRTARMPNGNATPIWNKMVIAPVVWRKPSQESLCVRQSSAATGGCRGSVRLWNMCLRGWRTTAENGCFGLERANVVIGLQVALHNLMRLARLKRHAIVPV